METENSTQIVADLHGHFYACFSRSLFFKIASKNLHAPETSIYPASPLEKVPRCLFLADLQWRSAEEFFSLFSQSTDLNVSKNSGESNLSLIHI